MIAAVDSTRRQQCKLIRVLKLIDLMAAYRFPKSPKEIHALIVCETGKRWSERTIRRDLELLETMHLAEQLPEGWRLDLRRSERLQTVALVV